MRSAACDLVLEHSAAALQWVLPIWTELTASCFILVSANSSLRLKQLCPARMAAFCHEWPAAGGLRLSTAPEAIVSHDS